MHVSNPLFSCTIEVIQVRLVVFPDPTMEQPVVNYLLGKKCMVLWPFPNPVGSPSCSCRCLLRFKGAKFVY